MKRQVFHIFFLVTALLAGFLFPSSSLAQYDLQVIAGLFVIFVIKKRIFKSKHSSNFLESIIFALIIVLIVNTTGGSSSSYFFLLYLLLFAQALLLEPFIGLVTTVTLVIFFYISGGGAGDIKNYINILSLLLISPFSFYLAKELEEVQRARVNATNSKENSLLFLSLVVKNQVKAIKDAAENFIGDRQLDEIKKSAARIQKLIDKYEDSV